MIRFFVVLFYFGIFFSAYGQSSCDEQKKKDSVLLLTFSQELKKAVMTYDMKKIADFLHFPFPYSYCKAGGTEKRSGDTIIDRKDFLLIKYGDFFGCWFSETVSKGYVKDVFYVYEINGFCKLVFSIPTCFPSEYSQRCKQHNFAVEKVNGQYKLTSSWLSQ